MVRVALLVEALVGCASSSRGPTWPKQAAKSADGGESLAPHKASAVGAEPTDEEDIAVIETVTEKPAAAKTEDKPAVVEPPKPTITAPDDILNVDDIVIDLDD